VPHGSETEKTHPEKQGRGLPRCGGSALTNGELQPNSSRTAFPPEVAGTERRNAQVSRARDEGMEPAMELWVDDRTLPVRIRVVGRLDSSTSPSLLAHLDQLLAEGVRHFLIAGGDLDIGDVWGASALTVFQRRTRDAGGSLIWEGLHLGHPAIRDRAATPAIELDFSSFPISR
jgi:glutathione S-transferase